jgi:hypothetical protein
MSTSFQSGTGGVEFSDIGMTSSQTGVTASVTMYQISTGATTPTAFVPSPLNYILGSDMTGSPTPIKGASYQTFPNGVVSLTTQSSRIVAIQAKSVAAGGYMTLNGPDSSSNVGYLRLLRGPSTFIDGSLFTFNALAAGGTFFTFRMPPTCFTFYDLSPPSGAATYILQGQTDGPSTQIGWNTVALFVRQI